jgi:two-component system cell cycle sensor histidine kinase/response regulator CckA
VPLSREPFIRYGTALASVAVATALRWLLHPVLGPRLQLLTYFGAVIVTATVGGIRPTVLTLVLSAFLAEYLFVVPGGGFNLSDPIAMTGLSLFAVIGVAAGWLGEARLRALAGAQQEAAESRRQEAAVRQLLAEARAAEDRFHAAVEASPNGMVMVDERGRIVLANREVERIFGYGRAELLGSQIEILVPTRFRDQHPGFRGEFHAHPQARPMGMGRELYGLRKDGSEVPVEIGLNPIQTEEGMFVLSSIVDVSARKQAEAERHRLEEQLWHAQKMEAIGRLAGGVAHEANNQMTVVLGSVAFALRRGDLPTELRVDLVDVQRAAQRTAAITAQLLAYGRRQMFRPEPLDLTELIASFAPILRRALGEGSELVLTLSPELGPVLGDRGQIEQVLVNMTLNARDAMAKGGPFTIRTEAVTLTAARVGSDPREPLAPGEYAVLTLQDTGVGMRPGTLARVFEPFFTTKPVGQGTGLGLSVVYGIVRQLGGDILVESAPGSGTTFSIYLPVAPGVASAQEETPARAHPATEGIAVLVVEDEPQVRRLAVRALEAEGFEVSEAEHGKAALEVLAKRVDPIQLVVTDVVMPVMGGRELAEQLASAYHGLPVLLMSGYATDELVSQGLLSEATPVLQKPFSPETLVEQVRAVLHASVNGDGGKLRLL